MLGCRGSRCIKIFFFQFLGGENNVAIDLIVRHVRTQLEQVKFGFLVYFDFHLRLMLNFI